MALLLRVSTLGFFVMWRPSWPEKTIEPVEAASSTHACAFELLHITFSRVHAVVVYICACMCVLQPHFDDLKNEFFMI
jgi:hypothetical protein